MCEVKLRDQWAVEADIGRRTNQLQTVSTPPPSSVKGRNYNILASAAGRDLRGGIHGAARRQEHEDAVLQRPRLGRRTRVADGAAEGAPHAGAVSGPARDALSSTPYPQLAVRCATARRRRTAGGKGKALANTIRRHGDAGH